jgi:hypothetical protein
MIQPDDIRRKAGNLYSAFLDAWLRGELFFPKSIRGSKQPDEDLGPAIASVQRLRAGSKETLGYGYMVEWTEINSRKYGRNLFPERIVFETQGDFLQYLGKEREFAAFAESVGRIRSHHPELESWIRSNRALLMEVCGQLDGLLYIIEYLRSHPRPGVFAREIPGPVDTKFIERNRRILREWLDLILPPQTIRADEEHFERRFGLRYAEPDVMLRFLDPDVQSACGCPWPELSLPLHTMGRMAIDVKRVLVVENKVSLLTLPALASTIALGGLGNSVTDLRYLPWLASCTLWYWGDLDAEGLAILSRLRSLFPHTRSLLMDGETLACWRDQVAVPGNGHSATIPPGLTDAEQSAFRQCVDENVRLEQERLPQTFVNKALQVSGFQLRDRDGLS